MKMKWIQKLRQIDIGISVIALVLLIAVTFAGVIFRYVFSKPFSWQEEVQLALIIWVIFFGARYAFETFSHVAIDMLYELFPAKAQKVLTVFDRSRCDRCSWMHRCFQHEIYTDYVSLSSSYQYFALALWMDLSAGSDQLYLYDHTVLGKFSGRTKDKKGGKINADICDPDRLCGFAFMFIF